MKCLCSFVSHLPRFNYDDEVGTPFGLVLFLFVFFLGWSKLSDLIVLFWLVL